MKTMALAAYSMGLFTSVQFEASTDTARAVDDALVLKAVIEHTILPAVRKTQGKSANLVLIADRSIPLCRNTSAPDKRCRIPEQWQQFLAPDRGGTWPGLIDNEQRRQQLVESLEARNALSHTLPPIDHPAVLLISANRTEKALQSSRDQMFGFASLSLPGYSPDGYALVYGSYTCGNLCGYS